MRRHALNPSLQEQHIQPGLELGAAYEWLRQLRQPAESGSYFPATKLCIRSGGVPRCSPQLERRVEFWR